MKNWILFFLLLMLSSTSIVSSKPSTENYDSAIKALEGCSILLKQEKQRWHTIHTNPVTDKVTVDKKDGNLILDVEIDDGVKNIINAEPIKRQYILEPDNYRTFQYFDLMLAGTLIFNEGWQPTFGIGYAPKMFHGFGVEVCTTFKSLNGGIYYTNNKFYHGFIHAIGGSTFSGKPTFGIGIGIRI